MRPDEHKKKKNAVYKKKHGIKEGGKNVKDKKSASDSNSDKRQPEGASVKQQDPRNAAAIDLVGSKEVSKNDDTHNLTYNERTIFKRRTIQSNWDRYEGLSLTTEDNEENIQIRGADFKLLVEGSGNALSQFQFKDEKEWNIEEGDTVEDTEIIKYLSIDSDELALALKCVPLHERLELDETDLQPSHIQRFEESANQHKENFMSRHINKKSVEEKDVCVKNKTELAQEIIGKTDANSEEDLFDQILGSDSEKNTLEIDETANNLEDLLKGDSALDSCNIETNHSDSKTEPKKADTTLRKIQDDCLGKDISDKTTTKTEKSKSSMEDTIDDELDFLLSMDTKETPSVTIQENSSEDILNKDMSIQEVETTKKSSPVLTTKETSSSLTDNLDDWLDSVLDD